jgi:enoyl-CoA hydratase/carnithine racemase
VVSTVRVERDDDGVCVLTMERPPVNALGRELVGDLAGALAGLAEDGEARCLVVRSGLKHFCAGADLKERRGMSLEEVREFVPKLAGVCNALADLPFPTIAAVRGAAIGGGCELALACDMRFLSDDCTIGLRETALAIIPAAGGTQRLPRLIGPSRAKRWIFAAEVHTAEQALAEGVADTVVHADGLDDLALDRARAIARSGPLAVRLAKRAIDEGAALPMPDALKLEWDCYRKTLGSRDREEALRAFAEKREPRFEGG